MDPQSPASFNHRTERLATGHTYHFVDQVPEGYDPQKTPTLLCIHGFPDFWFGWRYQIRPWVQRGWRVVVPDMLGYGGTDKPIDASEYSTKKLCADLAAILDLLQVAQAVIIGHDWGSFAAGRFTLWYPHRVLALVMMSAPYTPPSRTYIPVEEIARIAPNLGYQADFAKPITTSLIEAKLERFLALSFQTPGAGKHYLKQGSLTEVLHEPEGPSTSVLNDREFKYYCNEMTKGMHGPLNYYRTGKYRHEEETAADLPANLPSGLRVLFIYGAEDITATPRSVKNSRKFIDDMDEIVFEGVGHWVLAEVKEEVTERVANWITECLSKTQTSRL